MLLEKLTSTAGGRMISTRVPVSKTRMRRRLSAVVVAAVCVRRDPGVGVVELQQLQQWRE
jgi:hypothetical protein